MMPMTSPLMGVGWLLLLLALLAAGAVAAVLAVAGRTRTAAPPPRAEEELRMRYARGELDTEEYHARLAALRWPHDRPVD